VKLANDRLWHTPDVPAMSAEQTRWGKVVSASQSEARVGGGTRALGGQGTGLENQPPNPYEAPGCRETNHP
jgi:hypothetical protein